MKKKITSLLFAALLCVSIPLSAFATSKFDTRVFDGEEDLLVTSDDMTGEHFIEYSSLFRNSNMLTIIPDETAFSFVYLEPCIYLTDSLDYFTFQFLYIGFEPADLTSIIVKIGDDRYQFKNCRTASSVDENDIVLEQCYFNLKNETKSFMKALDKHKDDEIKVRLVGNQKSFDFTLTEEAVDGLLGLYDLFVEGGGTRESNFQNISSVDFTKVEKNGKTVRNPLPIIMDALSDAL